MPHLTVASIMNATCPAASICGKRIPVEVVTAGTRREKHVHWTPQEYVPPIDMFREIQTRTIILFTNKTDRYFI